MKRETKHSAQEQEQLSETKSQQTTAREFATAEEMLRADAAQTTVPPAVAERLGHSIEALPKPATSWWRRLLDR